MNTEDKELTKSRLKDSAFTSFWSDNYNSEINWTKNEQVALNDFNNYKNIVICVSYSHYVLNLGKKWSERS